MNRYEVKKIEEFDTIPLNTKRLVIKITPPDRILPSLKHLNHVTNLFCSNIYLIKLTDLPPNLIHLNCGYNQLTELPELPDSLETLYCNYNQLTELPELPDSLERLECRDNHLTELPALPDTLETLDFYGNQVTELPALPANLKELDCGDNRLTELPALPANLEELDCKYNNFKEPFLTIVNQYNTGDINLKELIKRINQIYEYKKIGRNLTALQVLNTNQSRLPENTLGIIASLLSGKHQGYRRNLPLYVQKEIIKRKFMQKKPLTQAEINTMIENKKKNNTRRYYSESRKKLYNTRIIERDARESFNQQRRGEYFNELPGVPGGRRKSRRARR